MGHTSYYLIKLASNHELTNDPSALAHRSIGVTSGNMQTVLQDYLSQQQLQAQVVICANEEDQFAKLRQGQVDAILADSGSSFSNVGIQIIQKIAEADFFMGISQAHPDLLVESYKIDLGLFAENFIAH